MNGGSQRTSPRSRRPFAIRRNIPGPGPLYRLDKASTTIRHTPRRFTQNGHISNAQQRENIRVVVRVRPPNSAESVAAHRIVVEVADEKVVVFDPKECETDFYYHGKKQRNNTQFRRNKDTKFVFDRVFPPAATNVEVFHSTIKLNLDALMEGFNCSIFAYGATGSGKTFTMLGSGPENPGLTILTLVDLYDRLRKIESGYATSVSVSYLEVYNETVRDLLTTAPGKPGGLNILEDENGVSVPNLTWMKPEDQTHLLQVLSEGNHRRTQHPTDHNLESSRSHAVFQVRVTIRARFEDLKRKVCSAKLVMVDLAGSERASATSFNSDRSREGASINKSLLALGNCINALADGKKHVPYRDSKLTRLLKDSLGGNCRTIVIANVSPSSRSYDDTHNTLKYADRAKHIRVNVKKNEVLMTARVAEYTRIVQDMQSRINTLQGTLDLYTANCTCMTSADESEVEDPCKKFSKLISSPVAAVAEFRSLKRRHRDVRDSLALLDTQVHFKKAKLAMVDCSGDWKAPQAAVRFGRQLAQQEQKRNILDQDNVDGERVINEVLNSVPAEETVPIPLRDLLRLNGAEAELQVLLSSREKANEFLKDELTRSQSLLSRSMAVATTFYQIAHIHNHTTRQQDAEFNAVRDDYLGMHRHLRWADQRQPDETVNIPVTTNLDATFAIP